MTNSKQGTFSNISQTVIIILLGIIGYFAKIGVETVLQINENLNKTNISLTEVQGSIKDHEHRIVNLEQKHK